MQNRVTISTLQLSLIQLIIRYGKYKKVSRTVFYDNQVEVITVYDTWTLLGIRVGLKHENRNILVSKN